jgi:hypothetical protein
VGDSLSFSLSFQQPSADFAPDDPTFGPYDLGSGTFTLNGGQFTTPIAKSRAQILNTAGGPFLIADELALVGNPLGEALPSRIGVGLSGDDFIGLADDGPVACGCRCHADCRPIQQAVVVRP